MRMKCPAKIGENGQVVKILFLAFVSAIDIVAIRSLSRSENGCKIEKVFLKTTPRKLESFL